MTPDTVSNFMHRQGIAFDVVSHEPTATSQHTAQAAHVPGDRVAKAIVLEDGEAFTLAVIPATHRLDRWAIAEILRRPFFLAEEPDFSLAFRDCRPGAVPPIGEAYGLVTIVDERLLEQPWVYFEAGDHEHMICVDAAGFRQLMARAGRGVISHHV